MVDATCSTEPMAGRLHVSVCMVYAAQACRRGTVPSAGLRGSRCSPALINEICIHARLLYPPFRHNSLIDAVRCRLQK